MEPTKRDLKSLEEGADRSVTGQRPVSDKARLPKDHRDYWLSKLKKRYYTTPDGQRLEIPEWQARMFCKGQDRWFKCESANKNIAALKAREIHLSIVRDGWDATVAKYCPSTPKRVTTTLGDYLREVRDNTSLAATTLGIYTRKTRTLLAGMFSIRGDRHRYYAKNNEWASRVDRIKLDRITTERFERWKSKRLRDAEAQGPLAVKQAKSTINSLVRSAKALFSPDLIATKLDLPLPLPLAGASLFPVSAKAYRYRSTIDPQALFAAAQNELAEDHPERFKVFLLALCAGLRRGEIDGLLWRNIDAQRGIIRIETTEESRVKTEDSEGEVDVDPAILAMLTKYMAPGCGPYVVKGGRKMRQDLQANYSYRCGVPFTGLIQWLRKKGVESHNPLHSLRKEYGSLIARGAGIFAASLALRHSDIRLTRNVYADKKGKVFLPIGSVQAPQEGQTEVAK
jgi:integrase